MDQEIPVTNKGYCINGRFVAACYQGVVDQSQCYPPDGLESLEYICDTTTDGFAVCVDTREACSPNCDQLKLGEYDGCNQLCGAYYNGDPLPCGDGAALSCDPELPQIECVEGFWSFTPN